MSIKVKEVETKKEFNDFLHLPFKIYRGLFKGEYKKYNYVCPNWISPLLIQFKDKINPKKNKIFNHITQKNFIAYEANEAIGRVSFTIDNKYISTHGKHGFFCFFSCVDNQEAADLLLKACENEAIKNDIIKLIGPVNQTLNDHIGNLHEGHNSPPVIESDWNPIFNTELYLKSGYKKEKDAYSYKVYSKMPLPDKLVRVAKLVRKKNKVTFLSLNKNTINKRWDELIGFAYEVYNSAWKDNWGFVKWDKAYFEQYVGKELRQIIDPEYTIIAQINDKPVGFMLGIPNINEILINIKDGKLFPFGIFKLLFPHKYKSMRVITMGVVKEYRNKGIEAIFIEEIYKRASQNGYEFADLSWVLEDNLNLRHILERWGAIKYKTFRIYSKDLI